MKNFLIVFIVSILGVNTINAQKNIIKANLLSPIFRTGSFSYERVISNKTSIQLGFYYTKFDYPTILDEDTKYNGYGITPEFRFYPGANAGNGFYMAPFLRYQNLNLRKEDFNFQVNEANLTTIGGGILAGRQWVFGDIISCDIFFGPCLNSGNIEAEPKSENAFFTTGGFEGFGIRTGITVGVAF